MDGKARCADNIKFKGNRIFGDEDECVLRFEKCDFADISDNAFLGKTIIEKTNGEGNQ